MRIRPEDCIALWQRINSARDTCYLLKGRDEMTRLERESIDAVYQSLDQAAQWALELASRTESDERKK